jgi:uncharacterized protein (DUF2249 family)
MTELLVDIRPVPPRDRFDVIAANFHALEPGQRLAFMFDHEPNGLAFALEAVAGHGAFRVRHAEKGVRLWQADVEKVP